MLSAALFLHPRITNNKFSLYVLLANAVLLIDVTVYGIVTLLKPGTFKTVGINIFYMLLVF